MRESIARTLKFHIIPAAAAADAAAAHLHFRSSPDLQQKIGDSGPPINTSLGESTVRTLKFHMISAAAAAADAAAAHLRFRTSQDLKKKLAIVASLSTRP